MPASPQMVNKRHLVRHPKRAPQPPNAFFLYRSDFLKRRVIPPEIENHQQNLSRIAGQCWRMLPETEKAIWYGKAAALRAEYLSRRPSHKTGPFCEDMKKVLKSNIMEGGNHPRCSFGRSGSGLTHSNCSRNAFSALYEPRTYSPAFQADFITPTSASEFSPVAVPSFVPHSFGHLLPSFVSRTNSSSSDSPSAALENLGNEIGDLRGVKFRDTAE